MANAVTIHLATVGASRVLDTFRQVAEGADTLQERVSQTRTAFLAVGGATLAFAAAAVRSHESIERLRRVLSATVGEQAGPKLAEQIAKVAESAKSSGDMLRQFAMNWVGMVSGGEESVLRMMRALDKMGGGLDAQGRQRASFQLAQIGALPTVQWEDLKELVQAGLPLQGVARRMGASNVREIAGRSSTDFIQAFLQEAESLPETTAMLTTRLANLAEAAMNSLANTGQRLSNTLDPLITQAEEAVAWFRTMNTDGRLGISVLKVAAAGSAYALAAYARAVWRATFALERLATSAIGASAGGAAAGGAAGVAGAAGGAGRMVVGAGAAVAGAVAGGELGRQLGGDQGEMAGMVLGAAVAPKLLESIMKGVSRVWGGKAIQGAIYTAFGNIAKLLGGSAMAHQIALALAPAAPALAMAAAAAIGWAIGRAIHSGMDMVARNAGYDDTGDWIHQRLGGGAAAREMAGRAANVADAQAYGFTPDQTNKLSGIIERQARAAEAEQARRVGLRRSDWQNFAANTGAAAAGAY